MNPNDQPQPDNNNTENQAPQTVENLAPSETPQPASPYPQQFQAQPPQYTNPQPAPAREPVNAMLIVLQWLTYVFWGWTVLALSILTTTIVADLIGDTDTGGFTPYGIAALLVLLPISYVCDVFYSKKEPAKKNGAEIIVMVIHAVIFAVATIGSLIYAVISFVLLFTSSGDKKGVMVGLISSLIIAVFYLLTFLRTLNPPMLGWIQRWYKLFMLISVGIIALLGLFGPVANERKTRDDRQISENISTIDSKIDRYTEANKRLPEDLSSLGLTGDSKDLIDRKLVEYKPEGSKVEANKYSTDIKSTVYRYQLCVTYKEASSRYGLEQVDDSYDTSGDDYEDYVDAYSHPAGYTCYKLKAIGSGDY